MRTLHCPKAANKFARLLLRPHLDCQAKAAAEQASLDPRIFFLPLAYATSLGGLITMIGSPPNLHFLNKLNSIRYFNEQKEDRCHALVKANMLKLGVPEANIEMKDLKANCEVSVFEPGLMFVGTKS